MFVILFFHHFNTIFFILNLQENELNDTINLEKIKGNDTQILYSFKCIYVYRLIILLLILNINHYLKYA